VRDEASGCTAECAGRASELCRAVQPFKPEIKKRSAGLAHEKSAISEYIIEINTRQEEGNEQGKGKRDEERVIAPNNRLIGRIETISPWSKTQAVRGRREKRESRLLYVFGNNLRQ